MTSRYPLRRNNAQVSVIEMLNKTVPNGSIAFAWALSDFHKNKELEKVPGNELHELLKQANLDSLYGKTPKNDWLAENKPNVIFCLMESMGQNMLTYDHLPETDLLGSLRKHFQKDFVFRRVHIRRYSHDSIFLGTLLYQSHTKPQYVDVEP